MTKIKHNKTNKEKRRVRVRSKLTGTAKQPRLTVFRSNKHIYLQVIDDEAGKTLVSACDKNKATKLTGTKTARAEQVSTNLAKDLKEKKIKSVVFDRGHYRYHGRVKAVAEILRKEGIKV